MGARVDQTDARAYVETSARRVIGDLRLLQQVADGDYDGGSDEMLELLGLDVRDDGCVDVDEAIDALYAMPLAVDVTTTFEIVLGLGGPDRRLCLECDTFQEGIDKDGRHPRSYGVRRVLYRYAWSGLAELELTGSDREVAEAFARRIVPQLG